MSVFLQATRPQNGLSNITRHQHDDHCKRREKTKIVHVRALPPLSRSDQRAPERHDVPNAAAVPIECARSANSVAESQRSPHLVFPREIRPAIEIDGGSILNTRGNGRKVTFRKERETERIEIWPCAHYLSRNLRSVIRFQGFERCFAGLSRMQRCDGRYAHTCAKIASAAASSCSCLRRLARSLAGRTRVSRSLRLRSRTRKRSITAYSPHICLDSARAKRR